MTIPSNDLSTALKRLISFRSSWDDDAHIDECSRLTSADLDLIIDALQPHADLEPGGSLTADDLGNMA